MSQLLKSAIADAKAVRATALANAKAALEEMFQPRLESMMAAKLQQEIEGEDENPDEVPVADAPVTDDVPVEDAAPEVPFGDAPVGDSAPTETPAADIGGLGSDDASDDASAEIPNNDEEIEEYGEGNIDPVEQSTDLTEESDAGYKKMTTGHKTEDPQGAKLVVKKLEGTKGEPKAQGEPKSAKAGAKTKDPQGPSDELASGPKKGEKNSTGNVLEEDDGEVSDDTLDEILAELEAEVSAVNTDATEEAPVAEVAPVAPAVSDEEEIDLDELLSEEKDEDEDDKDEDEEEKNDDDDDKKKNLPPWLQKENLALKKELQEYRKAVSFLRDRINEVNLLNAKLLYTNRLFKAASLTKEEKLKVIESFDLTKSVREAKLVYATLSESFSFGGKKALASKAVVRSITEGLASKPVASTKPTAIATARPELLSEGAAMAARFQKLAGITK